MAALAPSLALLIAGRALQGLGLGLLPLTMAAARDHLPRERVPATIALLSVCAAAGVGVGYPVSGLIAGGLGLSAAYWFGALVSAVAIALVFAVVPSSRPPAGGAHSTFPARPAADRRPGGAAAGDHRGQRLGLGLAPGAGAAGRARR